MSVSTIAEGFYKNLLNIDEQLYKDRIAICRSCKLYDKDGLFGEECNPKIYLNPETDQISNTPKKGFYHGCGCVLRSKTRVKSEQCPINKW